MTIIPLLIAAYLLGSIPFGLLLTQITGKEDIRQKGSGNIGATNVLRTTTPLLALMTLIADILKGTIPVAITFIILPSAAPLVAIACVVGHCFPLWLRFQGGKGVATFLGVVIALNPPMSLLFLGAFILFLCLTRYVSIASMGASCSLALLALLTLPFNTSIPLLLLTLLILLRHKKNIQNLCSGTESKHSL